MVPKWVEENPTLSYIKEIYGSGTTLPTIAIVLPLKFDKVKSVSISTQMFILKYYCSYQRLGSFQSGNIIRILGSIL